MNIFVIVMQVVLGTLLAALVPVVGFNAVMTSEHFASFLVSSIGECCRFGHAYTTTVFLFKEFDVF